jgi:hypothetical protein
MLTVDDLLDTPKILDPERNTFENDVARPAVS